MGATELVNAYINAVGLFFNRSLKVKKMSSSENQKFFPEFYFKCKVELSAIRHWNMLYVAFLPVDICHGHCALLP